MTRGFGFVKKSIVSNLLRPTVTNHPRRTKLINPQQSPHRGSHDNQPVHTPISYLQFSISNSRPIPPLRQSINPIIHYSTIPPFQNHSIIPLFHHSNIPKASPFPFTSSLSATSSGSAGFNRHRRTSQCRQIRALQSHRRASHRHRP